MKKMKLVKGLSYSTQYFTSRKEIPFEVGEEEAEKLMRTGRFQEIKEIVSPINGIEKDSIEKPYEKMKTEELICYAKDKDIDISKCKTNTERIFAIKEAAFMRESTVSECSRGEDIMSPAFEE